MKNYESIPEEEQANFISVYWSLLRNMEATADNIIDKHYVECAYRLWNRVTGDNHKADWEVE